MPNSEAIESFCPERHFYGYLVGASINPYESPHILRAKLRKFLEAETGSVEGDVELLGPIQCYDDTQQKGA